MATLTRIFRDDLTDRQLAHFWDSACRSGRADAFLYDRQHQTDGQFIRWCRDSQNLIWMVLHEGQPQAICALNGHHGKTAWGHFLVLPCGSKRLGKMPLQVAVCRSQLAFWLHTHWMSKYALDRVLGATPVTNRGAIHMTKAMGGKTIAEIPGNAYIYNDDENVNSLITVYTRETEPEELAYL